MPKYHEIKEPDVPWGDYGSFLFSGMNGNEVPGPKFPVQLMRTGPYVPGFTFPWGYFVMHADIADDLQKQNFKGVSLEAVEYSKITGVNWHEWDQNAEDPVKYPSGGEPENYVLRRKNNEAIAAQMPELRALNVPVVKGALLHTTLEEEEIDPTVDAFESGWSLYVTPRMMTWFKETVGDCISVSRAKTLFEQ